MEPIYKLIVGLLKAFMRLMGWRFVVTGEERIPARGAAVLVCNHVSYLDPVLVGYAADLRGRFIRFLAKVELFEVPVFGRMLRQMRHVPVDRHGRAALSFEVGVERLTAGELVGVFPEGTISTSFVPASAEAKSGAARMALATGAPLIPVALWGGQRIHTKHRRRTLRRNVALAVRVGEPVTCDADEDPATVTRRAMAALTELVDQAARTYPQRPEGPDDTWWLPRHLGGTAPSVEESAEARRRERDEKRARRAAEG